VISVKWAWHVTDTMPEGPLGGPRPFAESSAELNIYFKDRVWDPEPVKDKINNAIDSTNTLMGLGSPSGPHGDGKNVISLDVNGNQMTLRVLDDLKDGVSEYTGRTVVGVEVVW